MNLNNLSIRWFRLTSETRSGLFLVAFILLTLTTSQVLPFIVDIADGFRSDWDRLRNPKGHEPYELISYIHSSTSRDSIFLVFRMSEFGYYAQRKFISSLDPSMLPFFKTDSKSFAYNFLLSRDVDYIYVPPYEDPTITKTIVHKLLKDPKLTELVKDINGWRLYMITSEG